MGKELVPTSSVLRVGSPHSKDRERQPWESFNKKLSKHVIINKHFFLGKELARNVMNLKLHISHLTLSFRLYHICRYLATSDSHGTWPCTNTEFHTMKCGNLMCFKPARTRCHTPN